MKLRKQRVLQVGVCADYGGEILKNRTAFHTNPLGGQADRTPGLARAEYADQTKCEMKLKSKGTCKV